MRRRSAISSSSSISRIVPLVFIAASLLVDDQYPRSLFGNG
jgi:hypothetical protein